MSSKKTLSPRSHFVPSGLSSDGFDKGSLFAYSPVAAMLDRFKKAEAAWTQEKAQYRHEAELQRKKANKLQHEHEKLQTAYRHQTSELKSVVVALSKRDEQLTDVQQKLRDANQSQAADKQTLIDTIAGLRGERRELSDMLDSAKHKANMMQSANSLHETHEASLKDKVLSLETDRAKAESSSRKAKAEVAELQQECDKVELQNQLLQKLLEVQLKHNRVHVKGLHRFLESDSFQLRQQMSSIALSSSPSSSSLGVNSDSDSSRGSVSREDLLSSADLQQKVLPPSLLVSGGLRMHKHKHRLKGHRHMDNRR